jgi:prevent-host-death family protein
MQTISATEAKQKFGALLDAAQREPVHVQRHDRDIAVVLSAQHYDELRQLQLKQLVQQGPIQNSGTGQDKDSSAPASAATPPVQPRATLEEFRRFLHFMASQPPAAPHLREETFGREFLYAEHD